MMNEQKGLIHYLVEAVDRYRAERRMTAPAQDVQLRQPGRLLRLLRWLTPNGGTLLLVALLILTTNVWAKPLLSPSSVPGPSATTVNYQGRLADSGGNPITQNGVTLRFAIYDALTGENPIWPTTGGPETHVVDVVDGLFSVPLGEPTGGIPTSTWNGNRYLEITVGTETLSPRELIRSVPIAGMALTVPDGAIGNQQMKPTFFESLPLGDDFLVPTGTTLDDGLVARELTVDFPVNAEYLIFVTLTSRHSTDGKRTYAQLEDEDGNIIGNIIANSHPNSEKSGTHTTCVIFAHNFSAGQHTLKLIVSTQEGFSYVRNGTRIIALAIPFEREP